MCKIKQDEKFLGGTIHELHLFLIEFSFSMLGNLKWFILYEIFLSVSNLKNDFLIFFYFIIYTNTVNVKALKKERIYFPHFLSSSLLNNLFLLLFEIMSNMQYPVCLFTFTWRPPYIVSIKCMEEDHIE